MKKQLKEIISIAAISDLHYWNISELLLLKKYNFDVCICCGDISAEALCQIKNIVNDKPVLAVSGNHDEWNTPEICNVENIHCRIKRIKGCDFLGFGGSVRYKRGDYPMYTQKEALYILNNSPKADILISHESMYRLFAKNKAHEGFLGITWYLLKNHTKINICGHHHKMLKKIKFGITTLCVFRCALITYPKITVTKIF